MKDWKTTSAGILAIVGAIVSVVFAVKSGTLTQEVVLAAVTGALAGIGLLFAKDSSAEE